MKIAKIICMQAMMISVGILFAIGIMGIINRELMFAWYQPMAILGTGVLCALPSLVFMGFDELGKKKFLCRLVLHAVCEYFVVALAGFWFGWYSELSGLLYVSASYVCIYAFVWGLTLWLGKQDEKKINAALDHIRDKE